MAPEQQQDARSVDERADIFSLGKVIEDIVTMEEGTIYLQGIWNMLFTSVPKQIQTEDFPAFPY